MRESGGNCKRGGGADGQAQGCNIPTGWYVCAMSASRPAPAAKPSARDRLIDAAHLLVRKQGYAATPVDQICATAGVTKGAFFHHFASKEALATAAAQAWTDRAEQLVFTLPPWTRIADPLDRLLAHIDFRAAMMTGDAADFTCFVGTMVQEAFASSDAIRAACDASITAYAGRLAKDIAAAVDAHPPVVPVDPLALAYHIQAVLQGAFILAKARGDAAVGRDAVAHLKTYVTMLFGKGEAP